MAAEPNEVRFHQLADRGLHDPKVEAPRLVERIRRRHDTGCDMGGGMADDSGEGGWLDTKHQH